MTKNNCEDKNGAALILYNIDKRRNLSDNFGYAKEFAFSLKIASYTEPSSVLYLIECMSKKGVDYDNYIAGSITPKVSRSTSLAHLSNLIVKLMLRFCYSPRDVGLACEPTDYSFRTPWDDLECSSCVVKPGEDFRFDFVTGFQNAGKYKFNANGTHCFFEGVPLLWDDLVVCDEKCIPRVIYERFFGPYSSELSLVGDELCNSSLSSEFYSCLYDLDSVSINAMNVDSAETVYSCLYDLDSVSVNVMNVDSVETVIEEIANNSVDELAIEFCDFCESYSQFTEDGCPECDVPLVLFKKSGVLIFEENPVIDLVARTKLEGSAQTCELCGSSLLLSKFCCLKKEVLFDAQRDLLLRSFEEEVFDLELNNLSLNICVDNNFEPGGSAGSREISYCEQFRQFFDSISLYGDFDSKIVSASSGWSLEFDLFTQCCSLKYRDCVDVFHRKELSRRGVYDDGKKVKSCNIPVGLDFLPRVPVRMKSRFYMPSIVQNFGRGTLIETRIPFIMNNFVIGGFMGYGRFFYVTKTKNISRIACFAERDFISGRIDFCGQHYYYGVGYCSSRYSDDFNSAYNFIAVERKFVPEFSGFFEILKFFLLNDY